ncbi:MAG: autotransporter domain-containing protein [Deltaproteobacteria bacterium]|jgi:predicted outer membrane repeat protein|nr:autotransporter domain-containing protein [Deltaproteobacteria bacterium]
MRSLKSVIMLSLGVFFLSTGASFAADIRVKNEAELQNVLNSAKPGDRILLDDSGAAYTRIDSSASLGGTTSGFTLDGGLVNGQPGMIVGKDSFHVLDLSHSAINTIRNVEIHHGASSTGGIAGGLTIGNITQSIDNTAFRYNTAQANGGGVYVTSDFTGTITHNIHFDTNVATNGSGGGMYVGGNFLGAIDGSGGDVHFDKNTAGANGGGLYVGGNFGGVGSASRIYANYFAENTAGGSGGGMYVHGAFSGTLGEYAFFDHNSAGTDGGGLYVGEGMGGDMRLVWFTNNKATGNGGGLYAKTLSGNFTVSNFFNSNSADGAGGAIYLAGAGAGTAAFSGSLTANFDANKAGTDGGAIRVDNASDWQGPINGSNFTNNSAGGSGGAISIAGVLRGDINNSSFSSNSATNGNGGAIQADSITSAINGGGFSGNSAASGSGGAIYTSTISGNINGTNFSGNSAGGDGGAIQATTISNNIDGAAFSGNTAGGDGGAIHAASMTGSISNSTFSGNRAAKGGGAIYGAPAHIDSGSFFGNRAAQGGAIYGAGGNSQIRDSGFITNSAEQDGGALYFAQGSALEFHNAQFDGNIAGGQGGAIYFNTSAGSAYNITFSADADKSTSFMNNSQASGNNSFHVGGTGAGAMFNASITGEGTIGFYDPFTVNLDAGGFNLTHTAPKALLILSGINDINTDGGSTSFNFTEGEARLIANPVSNEDFTLRIRGNTDSRIVVGKNYTLTIMGMDERNNTTPLFDLTQTNGDKTFIVENGATLDISRILKPLPNDRYLLVSGLDPSSTQIGTITLLHPDGSTMIPKLENNNTELWLDQIKVSDAFNPRVAPPNLIASEACTTWWLNHTNNGLALTPYQVLALRDDLASGPPEAAVDMALVGIDIHDAAVRAATAGFQERGAESLRQGQFRFWSNYVGAIQHTRDKQKYSGYNVSTNGVLFGMAWEPAPEFAFGGYIGYSESDTDFRSLSADANTQTTHAGFQSSYKSAWGLRVSSNSSFSHNSVDMQRNPGGLGRDRGNFDQNILSSGLEFAYDIQLAENTRLVPAASVTATWLWQDSFTEEGKIMAARMDKVRGSSVSSNIGATLEHDFMFESSVITPGLGLSWRHQYTGRKREAGYAFVDNGNADYRCAVQSRELGADFLDLSAYIDGAVNIGNTELTLRGGYTLEAGEKSLGHMFYGGFALKF